MVPDGTACNRVPPLLKCEVGEELGCGGREGSCVGINVSKSRGLESASAVLGCVVDVAFGVGLCFCFCFEDEGVLYQLCRVC